ncbi:MAG: FtsB family cell division protein [Acetobacteraceae bacterium]
MAIARQRQARAMVAPLIFLLLTGYFVGNALEGPHGLLAYAKDRVRLAAAEQDYARTAVQRQEWEIRVAALRTSHLDADELDARSRAMLNLVNPSDIVVFYAPEKKLF